MRDPSAMWTEAFLRPELRALPVLEQAWGPQDADLETTAQKVGTEPTWEGTGGEKALGYRGWGPEVSRAGGLVGGGGISPLPGTQCSEHYGKVPEGSKQHFGDRCGRCGGGCPAEVPSVPQRSQKGAVTKPLPVRHRVADT